MPALYSLAQHDSFVEASAQLSSRERIWGCLAAVAWGGRWRIVAAAWGSCHELTVPGTEMRAAVEAWRLAASLFAVPLEGARAEEAWRVPDWPPRPALEAMLREAWPDAA